MTELLPILESGGPFAMAALFAWLWSQERSERKEAQDTERQTLREVLPAIAALEKANKALENK